MTESKASLLLVDDEELNLDMLSRRLERSGFSVQVASSGRQALGLIQERSFDLVLLDQMMPGMSGSDVLRAIRAKSSTRALPVIMVTAVAESDRVVEALELGANDYITKPVDFKVALARIRGQLARKSGEAAVRQSEDRYAMAARASQDGLWDWNVNTGVVYYSPRWREMIGLAPAEAPETPETWFSHIVPADRLAITELVAAYLQGPEDLLQCSYRMLHADGTPRWMSCRGIATRAPDGAVVRVAGSQSDVTEEKTCDRLTGLPNRLRLISQVECILDSPAHAKAGGNDAYAVLFLYLDGFKTISDSLGHAAGDHLLKAIASRLTLAAGASFLADPGNRTPLVVRMSGDEFAILLEGTANKAAVRLFATEVKQLMKEPFDMAGHSVHCTFSIGIALASPSHHVAEEVLREAGMAIYVAKFQRSGDLAVYDSSMRDAAMQRLELENDIRSAVGGCQLVLLYQPKVDLSTALTYGVEALVRWIHPQRGLLQPAVFIPIAEETGAIVEIGRWVFSEACLQVLRWHKQFPLGPPLELSVNLSPREFKQKDLVEEVRRTLQETGFPAASLHLEITENLLFEDMEAARATLYALKGLGVRLDLDDFGSGYSSLKYLRELPFDTLKIDSYFTVGLDPNEPASGKLIQAILNMGKNLGLQVVAEGIETEMHSTALRRLGCRFGQGFYYSRPLPREDMQARLAIERNTGAASLLSAPATVSPAHRHS